MRFLWCWLLFFIHCGFSDVVCCSSFIAVLVMLVVTLHSLLFNIIPHPSVSYRYGFEWAFFTRRRFLPDAPSPNFLLQPAFIKAFLAASSSFLKFAGLHADPRNTNPVHLVVWFTAIHNLDIQKNLYLNCTKYYHELLVVKKLVICSLLVSNSFRLFKVICKDYKKHFGQDLIKGTAYNRFDEAA